jgi:hypothetical protein
MYAGAIEPRRAATTSQPRLSVYKAHPSLNAG